VVVVASSHLPPSPTELPGLCLIFPKPTGLDFRLAFHLYLFHIRFSSSSFHLWMCPHVISLLVLLALIIKLSKASPQPSCNCLDQTIKPGLYQHVLQVNGLCYSMGQSGHVYVGMCKQRGFESRWDQNVRQPDTTISASFSRQLMEAVRSA
jgi:hypothetical protein